MADSPVKDTNGVVSLVIKTAGNQIPDTTHVLSVRATAGIGRIPEAIVSLATGDVAEGTFDDADGDTFKEGAEISIAGTYGGEAEMIFFKGVITGKRMRVSGERGPRLEIMARDKAVKLVRLRKTQLFQEKKDSDIMTAIISDAGLTAQVSATTDTAADHIQYDCTDWDFLRAIADRSGAVLQVADGKITIAEPKTTEPAVLTVTLGVDMLEFDARTDTQHLLSEAAGIAWNSTTLETVEGKSSRLPSETWGDVSAAKMAKAVAEHKVSFATSREVESAALKTAAEARLARSVLSAIQGRCTFNGTSKIVPGDMLELKGVGDRFGGNAYVGGVEQSLESGEWKTTALLGHPDSFVADATGFGSNAAQGLATPIHGLQIGTVVKLAEDPDHKLRIKVMLPLISAEGAEVWARYAQPYASNEAAIQFMPEIGDEVLVAFLNADPNAPIVVGSVHNGNAAQVNPQQDENNFLKAIVTREKLKIGFDDDKKILTLETPGGHKLTMDDDAAEVKLEDSNGNSLTMGSSGIVIDSAGSVEITASSTLDATAGSDATLSGANVTCSADSTFEGSGGASGKLSGGGECTVAGGVVKIN